MTKFFLWVAGEDTNEQLDLPVKILFNVMMCGISLFLLLNVAGLFASVFFFTQAIVEMFV